MKNQEKISANIEWQIPTFEQLDFRQKLYADKQTMDFGDAPFDFSRKEWRAWYDKWVKTPQKRFYAYLVDKKRGAFVGDINYHYDDSFKEYMIGIVILGSERGKGFAKQGLRLLLEKAKEDEISKVCNIIPKQREVAIHIHKALGFVEKPQKMMTDCVFLEKLL